MMTDNSLPIIDKNFKDIEPVLPVVKELSSYKIDERPAMTDSASIIERSFKVVAPVMPIVEELSSFKIEERPAMTDNASIIERSFKDVAPEATVVKKPSNIEIDEWSIDNLENVHITDTLSLMPNVIKEPSLPKIDQTLTNVENSAIQTKTNKTEDLEDANIPEQEAQFTTVPSILKTGKVISTIINGNKDPIPPAKIPPHVRSSIDFNELRNSIHISTKSKTNKAEDLVDANIPEQEPQFTTVPSVSTGKVVSTNKNSNKDPFGPEKIPSHVRSSIDFNELRNSIHKSKNSKSSLLDIGKSDLHTSKKFDKYSDSFSDANLLTKSVTSPPPSSIDSKQTGRSGKPSVAQNSVFSEFNGSIDEPLDMSKLKKRQAANYDSFDEEDN
ncbi:unnamed protein product [Gordionus sp. m RMFG-2023]